MSKQVGILSPSSPQIRRRGSPLATALVPLAAIAFVLSWSSGFIVGKIGVAEVPMLTVLVWRFIPLALGLGLVLLLSGRWRGITREQLRSQVVIGLFGQLGYVVFVYASVASGVSTGTTALIDAVQPLVIAALAGPLLHLRVPGAQWLGLGVGAVGVFLVVQSQFGSSGASAAAYAFPALAMLSLIAATILERRSVHPTSVFVTLAIHAVVATIALIALALMTGAIVPPSDATFWWTSLFLALVPTLAAYGLYWWLLRRVGVAVLNALLFLVAPTTAVAGALLFGEAFTVLTLAGFALSAAGVATVLVSDARSRRPDVDESTSGAPAPRASGTVAR